MNLQGKKIILGITGSIAAYKAAYLTRLFIKAGAEVQVLMTKLAKEFISPLTMATLSKRPILVDFYNPENGDWNSHVDLGLWADFMLIAPATANTMGKMANGICDNLLLTSYMSARCPVFLAPAMDLDMFQQPANQRNIQTLKSFGNIFIEPASGELASGLEGKGRMEEPENIVKFLTNYFQQHQALTGKHFLVNAGPTYEVIDAVRFIGNHSSGKMGYAIAEELATRGAKVSLVSGPVHISLKHPLIEIINVFSAQEMLDKCIELFPKTDGGVLSAAVADFKPHKKTDKKLKRKADSLTIELIPTQDIAAELGKIKTKKQKLVGFALEIDNEIENAHGKLKRKKLDFIVLNSLNDKGSGFGYDTNKITIIDNVNQKKYFELKPKKEVAKDIVNYLVKNL